MIILGIETSCDDTAAAVLSEGRVLSDIVSTQLEHRDWGGVVPEIASRAHLRNIIPVIEAAMKQAGINPSEVDAVAVTVGPGLAGALLVGLNFARGFALSNNIPLLGINHLQAHAWAAEIGNEPMETPFIALLVSGGHTSLALVNSPQDYKIIGQTLDDAAGEVLDKIGRLLGLNYPCGAEIERIAVKGDPQAVDLPRGMIASGDYNFSFSGLKTAARLFLERNPEYAKNDKRMDFLASLQEAVIQVLVAKTIKAMGELKIERLLLGGGVAANSRLRALLTQSGVKVCAPPSARCTDNAVMIAHLGSKLISMGIQNNKEYTAIPDLALDVRP